MPLPVSGRVALQVPSSKAALLNKEAQANICQHFKTACDLNGGVTECLKFVENSEKCRRKIQFCPKEIPEQFFQPLNRVKPRSSDHLEHHGLHHRIVNSCNAVVPNFGCSLESPGKFLKILMLRFHIQRSWCHQVSPKPGQLDFWSQGWSSVSPVKQTRQAVLFSLSRCESGSQSDERTYPTLPK